MEKSQIDGKITKILNTVFHCLLGWYCESQFKSRGQHVDKGRPGKSVSVDIMSTSFSQYVHQNAWCTVKH